MKPECFIIVDDDPYNNILCKFIIEEVLPKAEVFDFTDARKCIEYFRFAYKKDKKNPEAILLLDINMPHMNGWEFLEWFGQCPSYIKDHISIYLLSSTVDPRDKERASNHPAIKGFLTKPLEVEMVKEIVDEQLS
ncbi:MAG TPA: response regulator [Chitinophagaceae bacterium]|jgi:response regulator RpfG family c-di-GMP phosphodiesterase